MNVNAKEELGHGVAWTNEGNGFDFVDDEASNNNVRRITISPSRFPGTQPSK
jgi:hypothetical protein